MSLASTFTELCGLYESDKIDIDLTTMLKESAELSTEFESMSVVDKVKAVYEAGLFTQLPIGRKDAFTFDICGPDKERIASYFMKQPEFNYEINNEAGIVSHEFISDKYDVEVFDSFVSMYRIPQNESICMSSLNSDFQNILEELDKLYEANDDTEYSRAKRDYKHCVEFSDIDSSEVRDLVDKLDGSGIPYVQYEHKTNNGVTIFY